MAGDPEFTVNGYLSLTTPNFTNYFASSYVVIPSGVNDSFAADSIFKFDNITNVEFKAF